MKLNLIIHNSPNPQINVEYDTEKERQNIVDFINSKLGENRVLESCIYGSRSVSRNNLLEEKKTNK